MNHIKIKGNLEVISTEIIQREVVIGSKVIAKDEDGVLWDISGRTFPFEMKFHELPENYRASYHLKGGYSQYVIQADGIAEAKQKLIKKDSWTRLESIEVVNVYMPLPEAQEIMDIDEFTKLSYQSKNSSTSNEKENKSKKKTNK